MKRQILIVEDNKTISRSFARFIQQVSRDLAKSGLITAEVITYQAYNFEEAITILKTEKIDFVSLDIALGGSEEGLTDMQRLVAEPGGMRILNWMQKEELAILAAMISGETLISYAIDANNAGDVGVMGFLSKPISRDKYQGLIGAVLLYLDVIDRLQIPLIELKARHLTAARQRWDAAVEALTRVGWHPSNFPQQLDEQIKSLYERKFVDLHTGLPTAESTEEVLKGGIFDGEMVTGAVIGRDKWKIGYVTVTGYRPFVEAHPTAVRYIIDFIADQLQELQKRFSYLNLFIGHTGFPSEPTFLFFSQTEAYRTDPLWGPEVITVLKSALTELDVTPFYSQLEGTAAEKRLEIQPIVRLLSDQTEGYIADIQLLYDILRG